MDTATSENLEGKLASVLPQYIEVRSMLTLYAVQQYIRSSNVVPKLVFHVIG